MEMSTPPQLIPVQMILIPPSDIHPQGPIHRVGDVCFYDLAVDTPNGSEPGATRRTIVHRMALSPSPCPSVDGTKYVSTSLPPAMFRTVVAAWGAWRRTNDCGSRIGLFTQGVPLMLSAEERRLLQTAGCRTEPLLAVRRDRAVGSYILTFQTDRDHTLRATVRLEGGKMNIRQVVKPIV